MKTLNPHELKALEFYSLVNKETEYTNVVQNARNSLIQILMSILLINKIDSRTTPILIFNQNFSNLHSKYGGPLKKIKSYISTITTERNQEVYESEYNNANTKKDQIAIVSGALRVILNCYFSDIKKLYVEDVDNLDYDKKKEYKEFFATKPLYTINELPSNFKIPEVFKKPVDIPSDIIEPFYIIIMLDKSGSMKEVKNLVIAKVNDFISRIKCTKLFTERNVFLSLYLFGNHKEFKIINHCVNANNINLLSETNYRPKGGTALYDSLIMVFHFIKLQYEADRSRGLQPIFHFVTVTDGKDRNSLFDRIEIVNSYYKKFLIYERLNSYSLIGLLNDELTEPELKQVCNDLKFSELLFINRDDPDKGNIYDILNFYYTKNIETNYTPSSTCGFKDSDIISNKDNKSKVITKDMLSNSFTSSNKTQTNENSFTTNVITLEIKVVITFNDKSDSRINFDDIKSYKIKALNKFHKISKSPWKKEDPGKYYSFFISPGIPIKQLESSKKVYFTLYKDDTIFGTGQIIGYR